MPQPDNKAEFIWQVADDILRGVFKNHEYGDVTLPFVVLRRLDCVLEGRKEDILDRHEDLKGQLDPDQLEKALLVRLTSTSTTSPTSTSAG